MVKALAWRSVISIATLLAWWACLPLIYCNSSWSWEAHLHEISTLQRDSWPIRKFSPSAHVRWSTYYLSGHDMLLTIYLGLPLKNVKLWYVEMFSSCVCSKGWTPSEIIYAMCWVYEMFSPVDVRSLQFSYYDKPVFGISEYIRSLVLHLNKIVTVACCDQGWNMTRHLAHSCYSRSVLDPDCCSPV